MKKIIYFIAAAFALTVVSCQPKDNGPATTKVEIQIAEITSQSSETTVEGEGGETTTQTTITVDTLNIAEEGRVVTLYNSSSSFEAETDATGLASFKVPAGIYTASVSYRVVNGEQNVNYNGSADVTVVEGTPVSVVVPMRKSQTSSLIIKEVYNGGCMDNAGSKNYQMDKYIVVYNNSDKEVDASRMCLAMGPIANTASANNYAVVNGISECEAQGWTAASDGIWYFQTSVKIAPYSQISIAINGAIDHTVTYTNSVNLSNVDFCTYDLESGYTLATYYPAPSATIPTNHHMKAYRFGQSTAWAFGMQSAGAFLIIPDKDVDMKTFMTTKSNFDNRGKNLSSNYAKIPIGWIQDAVDIWSADDETRYYHRFPSAVSSGHVTFTTNKLGYSIYRNVDKEATEAIPGNSGKLVYNYAGAVDAENDGDPSGIDAEASIAAGAKIVYMDSNNLAGDFHIRRVASLKK